MVLGLGTITKFGGIGIVGLLAVLFFSKAFRTGSLGEAGLDVGIGGAGIGKGVESILGSIGRGGSQLLNPLFSLNSLFQEFGKTLQFFGANQQSQQAQIQSNSTKIDGARSLLDPRSNAEQRQRGQDKLAGRADNINSQLNPNLQVTGSRGVLGDLSNLLGVRNKPLPTNARARRQETIQGTITTGRGTRSISGSPALFARLNQNLGRVR